MNGMSLTRALVTAALLTLVLHCSPSVEPPLSGSETTNGSALTVAVVGSMVHGKSARGFEVALYQLNFMPDTQGVPVYRTFADDSGLFRFEQIPEGAYNLFSFAPHQGGRTGAVVPSLVVGGKNSVADTVTLDSLGSVQGVVKRDGALVGGVKIYAPGTPFSATTGPAGGYVLQGMPQGTYRIIARYLEGQDGGGTLVLADTARISVSAPDGIRGALDFDLQPQ